MKENQNVEYKESWRDEYLKWVCGFANAQGGKIFIGISDNGNVVGVQNAKKLLEDIPNKILSGLGIVADVNLLSKNEKDYLEIVVSAYPVAISCKGVYYYRTGSTLQTLSGQELETFLLRKRGASWDNMPLPGFTIKDVADDIVEHFKKLAIKKGRIDEDALDEPKDVLLEKLQLKNAGYYTNAAMLLFCKNPDKWQLGAYTKIGFFENDADLIYQDEIHGSLLEQVDKIMEVIYLKYMKAKITYEGIYRRERYFVPQDALREAVLNALCHKQYESCVPIQISVYKDKLYVANNCILPIGWTKENLLEKHTSQPYNKSIANVFYLAGFIESWGRGVEKIFHSCENNTCPHPEYLVNTREIMLKFVASQDMIKVLDEQEVTENFTDNFTENFTDNERAIINLIKENSSITSVQMSKLLNVSRQTIYTQLKSLKDKKIIERVGSDRKGFWKILK